jgi:hypothetical protein
MPKALGVARRIQRWYWGKLALLWAWGGVAAALLLTDFLMRPIQSVRSSITLIGAVVILFGLSVLTWVWLGSKESFES